MNKYQKKINKEINKIKQQEFKNIDKKYPIIKGQLRDVEHLFGYMDINSNKHYRQLKRDIKHKINNLLYEKEKLNELIG